MYYIDRPRLDPGSILSIEEQYGATYMGPFCLYRNAAWTEAVDIYYQPNPNTALGHTNYFGIFRRNDTTYITEGSSAFRDGLVGAVCEPDPDGNIEVLVSRDRNDYVTMKGAMIDGGRDYTKSNGCKLIKVSVDGPDFVFTEFKSKL
jgi:hypothetical protein